MDRNTRQSQDSSIRAYSADFKRFLTASRSSSLASGGADVASEPLSNVAAFAGAVTDAGIGWPWKASPEIYASMRLTAYGLAR